MNMEDTECKCIRFTIVVIVNVIAAHVIAQLAAEDRAVTMSFSFTFGSGVERGEGWYVMSYGMM